MHSRLWLHLYNTPNALFNVYYRTMESGPMTNAFTNRPGSVMDEWQRVEVKFNSNDPFQVNYWIKT